MTLTYYDADVLMRKYCVPPNEKVYPHSVAVGDYLYCLGLRFSAINEDELRTVGLLHDIGRPLFNHDINHAILGANFLRKMGYENYADIIQTHGISKEVAELLGIPGDFEPRTLEAELLTYVDVKVKDGVVVSFEERFNDALSRREPGSPGYVLMVKSFSRLKALVDKVDGLLRNT